MEGEDMKEKTPNLKHHRSISQLGTEEKTETGEVLESYLTNRWQFQMNTRSY